MRKILLWGRMIPQEACSAADILLKNKIASNPGNLLFTYSVARTVMTEDVELEAFYSEDVDRLLRQGDLSERYTCAVIPLADAFRSDFRPKLRSLTRFIRSVSFPCYIVGVGLRAKQREDIASGFVFDDDVKAFVSAVLDKSAMLGLRGAYTAEYLQGLGFVPEKHFTVIGCPAAYTRGSQCAQVRVKPAEELKRVSVNLKPGLSKQINDLVAQGMADFEDVYFVCQNIHELWELYFPYRRSKSVRTRFPSAYPLNRQHPLWKQGHVLAFLRAVDWMRFMQDMDFSFGSRIHGNMVAMLSGTPALVAVSDTRVRELAEFHGIPYVMAQDADLSGGIRSLYEAADFSDFARRYDQNFAHYVDFLNLNGIRHIYGEAAPAFGAAACDRAVASAPKLPMLYSGMNTPLADKLRTPELYAALLKYKIDRKKNI